MIRRTSTLLALLALIPVAGCGGSDEKPTTSVSGRVLCNGESLKAGSVMFRPAPTDTKEKFPGPPALGMIGEDGTFTLGTYGESDGAVRGRHAVTVQGVATGGSHDAATSLPCPVPAELYFEVGDSSVEVEITLGENGSVTAK